MFAEPIRRIAIVGGGIVAWAAAAAVRRQLPRVEVTVVAGPVPADALADRLPCTLPSIIDFHDDLGLTEHDTVVRAGSSYRLGTRFNGWCADRPAYIHAYGEHGQPISGVAFHHHWARLAHGGEVDRFEDYSAAAVMAREGRFVPPEAAERLPFGAYAYGLHIHPTRYREMMRAFALHLGAREIEGEAGEVELGGDNGFIASLLLTNGNRISADLFVDSSGPEATVRQRLGGEREDWSACLPCDRLVVTEGSARAEPSLLDDVTATSAGWQWRSSGMERSSQGLVYCSAALREPDLERLRSSAAIEPEAQAIALRQGRWKQPWVKNCVAIGDSAVVLEPLEWTNLHLAFSAIDRLVAMMPDRDCSSVETWDYNRQTEAELTRVRDFLMLHYATARRDDGEFWNDAARLPLPASLDHTLTQFRERGRLPFYEDETFTRDSWLAVLFGQGVLPRRTDPLVDSTSEQESLRAMTSMRQAIASAVGSLPTHAQYLQNLWRKAAS